MSYKIITDSCCDFTSQQYIDLNLTMIPLTVEFRGEVGEDRNDDSLKTMYDAMRAGEGAKTSAANPDQWARVIEPVLEQGHDALVMAFSSGLSTTYQSAVIASQELSEKYPDRKILVCDTLCASMGQGLLVWYACRKRDEGVTLEEVYNWVEENKLHLCHWFTVDDLMHLKRGGRVSAATAIVGTMLGIKPVLQMDSEGHLIKVGTARGRKKAIEALAEKYAELSYEEKNTPIFISHAEAENDAKQLADILKQRHGAEVTLITEIGPVIGSHAGPGTIALFFIGKHR